MPTVNASPKPRIVAQLSTHACARTHTETKNSLARRVILRLLSVRGGGIEGGRNLESTKAKVGMLAAELYCASLSVQVI